MGSLRRLPEALIATVFSALELREHCAFRHCARLFAEIACRPSASPQLLRILAQRSPPVTSGAARKATTRSAAQERRRPPLHRPVELAVWEEKREAQRRACAPWDGRTRVDSLETLGAARGLQPRRLDLSLRDRDADASLGGDNGVAAAPSGSNNRGGDEAVDRTVSDRDNGAPRWTAQLRDLKITGWRCVIPRLATLLRFAPRLVSLESAEWAASSCLSAPGPWAPPPPASSAANSDRHDFGGELLRLKVGNMSVEECGLLPKTLTDLDVELPAPIGGGDGGAGGGDEPIDQRFFAETWTAAVANRFASSLTRLRFGNVGAYNTYSLETLTAALPHLTDLDVPWCKIPTTALATSRLERLECSFLAPAVTHAASSEVSAVVVAAAAIVVDVRTDTSTAASTPEWGALVNPPLLFGRALHTLDFAATATAFRAPSFECVLGLATSAAPSLTALFGMRVSGDAEFERAATVLAASGARLSALSLRASGVTTMAPLARFADSLRSLGLDEYRPVARLLAAVDAHDFSHRSPRLVAAVARLWPSLPKLESLTLHSALNERDMYAIVARYPTVVSADGSFGNDTHNHWGPRGPSTK